MLCLRQMLPQRVHLGCRKSKLHSREINTWGSNVWAIDRRQGAPTAQSASVCGMRRSGRGFKYLEQVGEKRGKAEKAEKPRHVGDRRQDDR